MSGLLPLLAGVLLFVSVGEIHGQTKHRRNRGKATAAHVRGESPAPIVSEQKIIGVQVSFVDGTSLRPDEVWKQGDQTWVRIGNVTQLIDRPVKSIEPIRANVAMAPANSSAAATARAQQVAAPTTDVTWLLLKGGARIRVDEISENETGAWFRRANVSMFLERDRIERIEHESDSAKAAGWIERGWTTGNEKMDGLIRANANRFSLDPYLVFCVIEHESHFQIHAVSPKGARGLMQLMPGTARRFGVSKPFDPAQNIFGGTQYLKGLLQMFDGRLDLALASYNAGEGAVIKYGRNVPPYRETRDYVNRLTRRYGSNTTASGDKPSPSPR